MRHRKHTALFKRSTALLLALVMVLSMSPMPALSTGIGAAEENPWNGRSAVFVGDSITAGSGTEKIYYEYLQEALGFGSVTAMGVAGSCISAASDYGQSNQPLIDRYQNIPTADLIVVFMGTNDYGHETPLGSAEDTQDGTFYGALNTIVPALAEKHTSGKLVFVTPLHRYGFGTSAILGTQFTYDSEPNGVGATLGDYVQALKTVCANNGVSVIDLYTECTLDPADEAVRTSYMSDGLHPNAAGHELIAQILETHIRSYSPVEEEPVEETQLLYGNKFASGYTQQNRASSRVNCYLKAGTVITLKDAATFQWACAKTSGETSSDNLGYFPDSGWSDQETAVVEEDGWVGFTFKYRDETQSFDLTKPLSDYITIEEPHTHTYENGVCTICGEKLSFEGKTISILGDSISTYTGISNNTAYNSTIGSNAVYYGTGALGGYQNTWWQQAVDALGMELLVNNSWSGSCVLHTRSNTAGAYQDRCVQLHNDSTGEEPDVIVVFLGTNDFSYYQSALGTADIDYSSLITDNSDGTYTYADPATTCEAYAVLLHKLTQRYPDAQVYCMTLTARRDPDKEDSYADVGQPTVFNGELVEIISYFGCTVVDLENCGIDKEAEVFDTYMGDGRVHPNAEGMDLITQALLGAMLRQNVELVDVSGTYSGVSTDNTAATGILGGSYSASLALSDGYSDMTVTVTMDGQDVTDCVYEGGIITVETVTGDIVITAEAVKAPMSYCWEFDGTDLVTVGDTENTLTRLAGTTADGIFTSTRYQLADSVQLRHDLPWVVEWKGEGSGGFMLAGSSNAAAAPFFFRRAGNYLNAFGDHDGSQYNNYGLALDTTDIDGSLEHVYRLENRIASDGSNMVYLYVDGVEAGALNNYYVGGTSQGTTGDWISGKDFTFSCIGTTSHPLTNYALEYLQVFEAGDSRQVEIPLGDFAVAGVGSGALTSSEVLLSQKTLISVPHPGAELTVRVADGYQVKIHSGNNANKITSASQWLDDGNSYTLPADSIYMRISIRRTDSAEISVEELEEAGVSVSYFTTTDVVEDNRDTAQLLQEIGMPVLIHISDIHGDVIRAQRAAQFADWIGASALLASGDLTAYQPDDWGLALFEAVGKYPDVNFLYGIGNHDTQIAASSYQDTVYNAYFKDNPLTPDGETYYYQDLAEQKLRIISVNQQEGATTTTSGGTCYSQAQVDWLVETLKSTPAGYGVVLMYHSPETTIANAGDQVYTEFFQTGNRYDSPTNSYSGYSGTFLTDLVDAFMLRENFTWNYSEQNGASPVTLNADFTGVADGVEFIAHVTGHVHSDSVTYLPGTACKQLLLGVTCTTSMYGADGGYAYLADVSDLNRVGDTASQDAFNAYIIDRENKTVRILRIGAKQTVSGGVRDDMTIPYSVPFEDGEYLFDTDGLVRLDMSNAEWVNYGYKAYGVEPTYLPGVRWSADAVFDVPYEGVTFYIKINAPYEMGIRSGETDTAMDTNYYWLNNKELTSGGNNRGFVYTLPSGHTKFILSVANITRDSANNVAADRNPISFLELQAAGLEIWYKPVSQPLSLRYDDHYDVSGKTVEIVDAGTPTSYQVGYGVAEGTMDTAVVTLEGDTLVAAGIGTAMVRIDGVLYEVTVTAAPISLLLLIGQSNMRGSEGNADQSIVCPDGMVYATFGDDRGDSEGIMNTANAAQFAASALTGPYSTVNVEGTTDHLSYYPLNSLTADGKGTFGPDSGFAYEWVKQTGEKVWVVNAAHGGSSITTWQPGATNYAECVALFSACQETLRKEIAAGHYTLSHMGYFWCQGCTDYSRTAEWYAEQYLTMHESLKTDLAFSESITFEFAGVIPVRAGMESYTSYRQGVYADTTTAAYYESFKDLRFTGPRVAQYWMINNPELPDIWGVCNIGEDWVWMSDGTNGVTEYFQSHYENGTVDYTTQVQQSAGWYTPTTPKAVHDSIHYNQIGYNEVGRESARNALILLGEIEAPEVETTVELLTWDGYTAADTVSASTAGSSATLVVPVVSPIWKSKDVTYELSEGLTWDYYDLLADAVDTEGTLTAVGAAVSVSVSAGECGAHFIDHLSELPEDICAGTNLWTVLEHDPYYFENGAHWGIHSSGSVYSVTVPVCPGDRIYATSFGAAGTNGSSNTSGIRVTFFSDTGIALTLSTTETYEAFTANGGCLIVPEGTVAVNIPMWNNSDENEIYILNLDHGYSPVVTAPTCTEQGYSTYTCDLCGESYVADYVDALGHSYSGTACSLCGVEHPQADNYSGKVISILGASICTFDGYIPVADGFNLQHYARYPQDDLLTDVNDTWWMQVINGLDAKLGINDSWRSTEVYNACTEEVNSSYDGTKACLSSLTRIRNLGSNGTPDVILFFGGTNDITQRRPLGTFDPQTAPAQVDLTSETWETVTDAYTALIMRLQYYYPDSKIVVLLPYGTDSNSDAVTAEYTSVFAAICEHYGVSCVDLMACGISRSDLPDGTHPDAEGMDYITAAVLNTLLSECETEPGEHVVYSVEHSLTNAHSSLGYYKGVSAGHAFEELLTGEDLTVTVTMNGEDITSAAYADGKISIPSVTGDLVIAAKGMFDADGRLQQLPQTLCAGTNLWTVLEPVNEYYTANGWATPGSQYSVTFPVAAGERIWATCFGTTAVNGFAANGVRITWFSDSGVLESLPRETVYAEFAEYGYLTVPEGAVAVNIPMASSADTWEIFLLDREHIPGEAVKENEGGDGSYESAVYCTACGEELSRETLKSHTPGDINGDGEVNNKDLTRLFRYLTGYDVEVVEAALDVNGDGSVNNKDQTRLFRYLSGWDVEIF